VRKKKGRLGEHINLAGIAVVLIAVLGLCSFPGCTEEGDTTNYITGNENVIEQDWNDQDTSTGNNFHDAGCDSCDEGSNLEDGRCWSSCTSKNLLSKAECERCAAGERSCVWPWQVDEECLNE